MNEANKVKQGMDVICSCGKKVGQVDRIDGDMIRLERDPSSLHADTHYIPVEWVDSVDSIDRNVVLNLNSADVERVWAEEPVTAA